MDLHHFFTASRVLVVAGKGGVGKTTVSAVIARAAAKQGLAVLVVELEGKAALAEMLGGSGLLPYEPVELDHGHDGTGRITGRALDPARALSEYLDDRGLRRVSRRLATSGIIDVVSTASPGIDDILVLAKLKQIERAATDVDLIVVDGPAAGHAITFLQAARGLGDVVRSGPIATQAADVSQMLSDPARCQVVLVTSPETTPVNELVETAYALEDRVGVQLAPVVVNGVDPLADRPERLAHMVSAASGTALPTADAESLQAAAAFRTERCTAQAAELHRLGEELALAQIHLPWIATAGLAPNDIDALADAFTAEIARSVAP